MNSIKCQVCGHDKDKHWELGCGEMDGDFPCECLLNEEEIIIK